MNEPHRNGGAWARGGMAHFFLSTLPSLPKDPSQHNLDPGLELPSLVPSWAIATQIRATISTSEEWRPAHRARPEDQELSRNIVLLASGLGHHISQFHHMNCHVSTEGQNDHPHHARGLRRLLPDGRHRSAADPRTRGRSLGV